MGPYFFPNFTLGEVRDHTVRLHTGPMFHIAEVRRGECKVPPERLTWDSTKPSLRADAENVKESGLSISFASARDNMSTKTVEAESMTHNLMTSGRLKGARKRACAPARKSSHTLVNSAKVLAGRLYLE